MIISNGTMVNGDELVKGLNQSLPGKVNVTGGLAGDGANFEQTLTFHNNEPPKDNSIIAIGFYGEKFHVGYGSMGGWDAFGPQRKVTKASGNVLYELDGESALEVYKKYLGVDTLKSWDSTTENGKERMRILKEAFWVAILIMVFQV